ncbi:MAG: glycosyl transferase family 1 [Proteobacteria bacterium]|nr:MAG: glycosyl transferase family 1 [Pseudomonadota bacterium]
MSSSSPHRRVLLALESSGPGGAENMLLVLADELARKNWEPIFATLRPGWLTERALAAGHQVWILPQQPGLDPGWVVRLGARLRRERIDVVHAHEFAMSVYASAAARALGLRAVATLHGHHWIAGRAIRGAALRWLHRLGMPLVAVSDELAGYVAQAVRLPRARIAVIPNGIPLPPALGAADEREIRRAVRAALGVGDEQSFVLAVGNLYPVKGHATLLQAAAKLPGVAVAIAGRGDEEPRLAALARSLGVADRVRLLGLRDDVGRLLVACDVFAHPSLREGLPLAVLEAMAAARAVVAARVGGIPEAVREGETGLLVPPEDPDALACALAALLSDAPRRAALGAAGRARVAAELSSERMAARYVDLYERRTPR